MLEEIQLKGISDKLERVNILPTEELLNQTKDLCFPWMKEYS
jgi:hypothetical protein